MKPIDYLKAAAVGVAVMVLTVAASFPMVAFYATVVEPGHPQAFYNDAATWIAPWSSHVLGPVLFFAFNYWLARRRLDRNSVAFAAATIALYALIDFGMMLPFMPASAFFNPTVALSLIAKAIGAVAGGVIGRRQQGGVRYP